MKNNIQEYDFKEENLELGFEIVNLNYFYAINSEKERTVPHKIKFYAMLFITGGTGEHLIDFKSYTYQENSLLFIGKDQIHAWKNQQKVSGFLILFTQEFLFQNQITYNDLLYTYPYNSILYKPFLQLNDYENTQTFNQLITYIYNEYNTPPSKEKQEVLQCLLRALLLKIKTYSNQHQQITETAQTELFIRFQRLLNAKITSTRNAQDYCKWLNVSYNKLNDSCKTLTKKTIKSFIDDFVMLKAKRQLIDGNKNVSEVAYSLGFNEVTNFIKFFTKHAKTSPKKFQSSSLK